MSSSAEIQILRPVEGGSAEVAVALITAECKRVWKLMEEDSITLVFTQSHPVAFQVGDYCQYDSLLYYVTQNPLPPAYDSSTGGYKHTLRLDRSYVRWKNSINKLVRYSGNSVTRPEASWNLTDRLEAHVQNVILTSYYGDNHPGVSSYCLDGHTVKVWNPTTKVFDTSQTPLDSELQFTPNANLNVVALIQYAGVSIWDSLTSGICQAFDCEWWVVKDSILCIGKCECGTQMSFSTNVQAGDYRDFWGTRSQGQYDDLETTEADSSHLDFRTNEIEEGTINVEEMSISRNENEYANRLFVFGSTKNIPYSYRKKLNFEANVGGNHEELTLACDYGTIDSDGMIAESTTFKLSEPFNVVPGDQIVIALSGSISAVYSKKGDIYTSLGSPGSSVWTIPTGVYQCIVQTASSNSSISVYLSWGGTYVNDDDKPLTSKMILGLNEEKPLLFSSSSSSVLIAPISIKYDGLYNLHGSVALNVNVYVNSMGSTITLNATVSYVKAGYPTHIGESQQMFYNGGRTGVFSFNLPIEIEEEFYSTAGDGAVYIGLSVSVTSANPNAGASIRFSDIESGSMSVIGVNLSRSIALMHPGPKICTTRVDNSGEVFFLQTGSSPITIGEDYVIEDSVVNVLYIPDSWYESDLGESDSLLSLGERRLMLPDNLANDFIGDDSLEPSQIVEKVVIFDNVYPRCGLRITNVEQLPVNKEVSYPDGSKQIQSVLQFRIKVGIIAASSTDAFPFTSDMQLSGQTLEMTFLTQEEESSYGAVSQDAEYQLAGLTFKANWDAQYEAFVIVANEDYGATLPSSVLYPVVGDPLVLAGWNVKAMSSLGLIATAESELYDKGEAYIEALATPQYTFTCKMMADWALENPLLNYGQRVKVYHNNSDESTSSRVIAFSMPLDYPHNRPEYTIGETERYSRLKQLEKQIGAQSVNTTSAVTISGGGGGGGSVAGSTDWYNLITAKTQGSFQALIENFNARLTDTDKYRMLLLRWRKGTKKPMYYSWHAPLFSRSGTNAIAAEDRWWPITSNKQAFFAQTGHTFDEVLSLLKTTRSSDGKPYFKNVRNRKMRFGCAIYKNTGEGTYGWQRVSNIAEVELYITDDNVILKSIRR